MKIKNNISGGIQLRDHQMSSSINLDECAMNRAYLHRAYQPITPANNKLLKKLWDQRKFDLHRKKVRNATPVIDDHPPQTYMHVHLKLKKLQMEEERLATIERDNRILLEKMCYIMRTRGRVDHTNDYEHKSLNKTKRQREILRVTHENQAILRRILSKEANYNHLQWEHDWELNKQYMKNIAKYPPCPQWSSDWMDWNRHRRSMPEQDSKVYSSQKASYVSNQPTESNRSVSRREKVSFNVVN